MSRLSLSRSNAIEKPRRKIAPFEPYEVDPQRRRGHLKVEVLHEHDGAYKLRIDGRPADLITFDGRLHWDNARTGPLVDDVDVLLSLCNQMRLSAGCLKRNFVEIWRGAEVAQ